jgi:hypothetical protein
MNDSLDSLAAAVQHEIRRLVEEYYSRGTLDLELVVTVDAEAGTVVVVGPGLRMWGPRALLETRLTRAGLRYDTLMPSARIVVYPAAR